MRAKPGNILSRILITLLISISLNETYAQDPWNAKIMLHSLNGYVDTLWIGCDVDGGAGYQEGLDVIDTTFVTKGGIWGYDPSIPAGECFNLKKDIKNFVTGIQTFNIQIADTDFNQTTQFDYISIDTNDFKFNNGTYKLTSVYVEVSDGYIIAIDLTHLYLYDGFTPDFPPTFSYDSISLIFEPDLFDCLPINDYQMRMKLEIGFNYYPMGTGIDEIEDLQPLIYPNPVAENLHVKSKSLFNRISIIDAKGNYVYFVSFEAGKNQCDINMKELQPGIYVLLVEQLQGSPQIMTRKIIIL